MPVPATATGYAGARSFTNLDQLSQGLPDVFSASGPQMSAMGTVPSVSYPRDYDCIHSAVGHDSFSKALNQR